jgi:hypothetical protein
MKDEKCIEITKACFVDFSSCTCYSHPRSKAYVLRTPFLLWRKAAFVDFSTFAWAIFIKRKVYGIEKPLT